MLVSNERFLIIKNLKHFILGLEKIILTFPKKDIINRNLIYNDALLLMESCVKHYDWLMYSA